MGTADFAVPGLHRIAHSGHDIISVVTAPDLPRGRGQKVSYTPVKTAAKELNLPVIQPENLRDPGFVEAVRNLNPDLIVVIAFRILPKEVFLIPKFGSFNLHASLLPRYRGAAPINHALMNGDEETGVTTFFLKEKVDTGNIILQNKTAIGGDETAGELHDRLSMLGADAVIETIELIEKNQIQPVIQNESMASSAPKLTKENTRINWKHSAQEIKNFIRGLSPYPCAWTTLNGKPYKLYRSTVSNGKAPPDCDSGTILSIDHEKGIGVVTGNRGLVFITEIQPPSKKRMTASEFIRGYSIRKNDFFN